MIDSTKKEINNNRYSISYEIDIIGGISEINDNRVTDETIAETIARAEFLENGYTNQVVEFTADFVDLKMNDIISIYAPTYRIPKRLNKDKFIVKRIEHTFQNGIIKTKIKAIRYDL